VPDYEIPMTNAPDNHGKVWWIVNSEGATNATGSPFKPLKTYFAYIPALFDVPRAARYTKDGFLFFYFRSNLCNMILVFKEIA